MSPALANFLFEAANFLVLAGVLGWILFKPMRRTLDAEQKRYQEREAESRRLRAEAEALLGEARETRASMDHEIETERQSLLRRAEEEAAHVLDEARRTQAAERRALAEELETRRARDAEALADAVGRIAGASVRRLLEMVDGPSIDVALVRVACDELRTLPKTRGSVLVESARPLDDEARRLLQGALGPSFAERVVSDLGAGVRVTTSAGQVDVTALSVARQAAGTVRAAASDRAETHEAARRPSAAAGGAAHG